MIMYFGSKISDNKVLTPEGYLICKNVPIGRVGWMDYLGEELGIEEKRGQVVKVYRSPEQLFSKATIASFEGKSVTNNHPSKNLTIDTVSMIERGHIENVRPEGEYLVADLYVKDKGLISEIDNGKKEVSCGYDCLWVPLDGERFEQKEIVGNHVAVVQNGRAGARVAIKDSLPGDNKEGEGRYKNMKITQKFLAAIGFQKFAQDAKPEEIAEAMEAMKGEGFDAKALIVEKGTDSSEVVELRKQVADLAAVVKTLMDEATEEKEKEGADAEFESLEKEVSDEEATEEVQDAETVESDCDGNCSECSKYDTCHKEMKDEAAEEKPAMDSIAKFIKDMKPIIMAIPDAKARDAAAKQFVKSVRDARTAGAGKNGYGTIVSTVAKNKYAAMDNSHQNVRVSQADAVHTMVANFNKLNAQNAEGGK
jgi:hypothetical protein